MLKLRWISRNSSRSCLRSLASRLRERLVEQQHLRRDDQRARERDALLLAAGKLLRIAVAERRKPHARQHVVDLPRRSRLSAAGACAARRRCSGHGEMGKQRVVLEHHRGAALVARQVIDRPVLDQHRARIGLDEARDDLQRRGLAATRGAEDRQDLALADRQRHVADDRMARVALGDARAATSSRWPFPVHCPRRRTVLLDELPAVLQDRVGLDRHIVLAGHARRIGRARGEQVIRHLDRLVDRAGIERLDQLRSAPARTGVR